MLLDTAADLKQVALGGTLALLILDRVFSFLNAGWYRHSGANSVTKDLANVQAQLSAIAELLAERSQMFQRQSDRLAEMFRMLERLEHDLDNLARENRTGREKMGEVGGHLVSKVGEMITTVERRINEMHAIIQQRFYPRDRR